MFTPQRLFTHRSVFTYDEYFLFGVVLLLVLLNSFLAPDRCHAVQLGEGAQLGLRQRTSLNAAKALRTSSPLRV